MTISNFKRGPLANTLTATVVFLVLTGIAAVSWITIKEFRVQQSVYTEILQDKLEATRSQFRMYLTPFPNNLETIKQWHKEGLIDLGNPDELEKFIIPLVNAVPQIASVYIVPPDGPYFCLLKTEAGWTSKLDDSEKPPCRQQTWYLHSLANKNDKSAHWSGYVFLPGLKETGLVAGALAPAEHGDLVIGLGMRENFLDQFTASAPITENGILIRRYEDGNVAWLTPKQGNRMNISSSQELLTSHLKEHQIIGHSLMAWGDLGKPYSKPLNFRFQGNNWWCSFYPAIDGTDPGELGLIAPASDLGQRLETITGRITWIFAAVLGLATLALIVQAFSYSRKWRRFSQRRLKRPETEEALETLVHGGESDHVEFKSTMRWNLRADKPGKEIEKAWLKSVVAYLNTDGGFLFIGIADDGEVLGLENDKFANEDKFLLHFDNLIKQHIGLEFASFIKAEIRTLKEHNILLVACDRCNEAAFLKIGENEDFFIRMGPSTRSLPASRVMDYLREREA